MKVIFLDFDGVMDTAYYGHILGKEGLPYHDEFGVVFDPNCVVYLKEIIDKTGAEIVVTSSWKSLMSYEDLLNMWAYHGLDENAAERAIKLLSDEGKHLR